MEDFIGRISISIQKGKVDINSPYPPDMKGQPGAFELTGEALENGVSANDILTKAMIPAMGIVGDLFKDKKLFVPQVLMCAKAMNSAMSHLKPYFSSGEICKRGTFVIGTVSGDLHDIGKNLVSMMIEGSGWTVVDLGVDVKTEKFLEAIGDNPGCILGMSALLTTTMESMEKSVRTLREVYPSQKIIVGGAPLNNEFAHRIGADLFAPNPQIAVEFINSL
ncbi:MAG: corrinoid protein [Bacteroidales bacterium]|nr:cobalamin-binding protein [Bacteroidota bacterium]MCE5320123.1 corrinoid protein [Bacteroidales bacterium]MDD2280658.1 corrinoid protein [Bacteroidales bacterium]MDD4292494.1 corrinoid protein [Bacteroidales bacterium]MDD4491000.1 corrinoid protein [Bacteroidales bacterium]